MEIIQRPSPYARFIAPVLTRDFVLLDIGCSGGIDPVWREFGTHLTAIGIDANVAEIERLKVTEANPRISYEAGLVGVPADDPILQRRAGLSPWGRNPWSRLAVSRTQTVTAEQIEKLSIAKKTEINAWDKTELSCRTIYLPTFFLAYNLNSIDFLKIDIDGNDFDVLQSIEKDLFDREILGVCAEVNFFGSHSPTEHTFHNTDRLMKAAGFELFALTLRTYSGAALPSRYVLSFPAQSVTGRPLQGDAVYLRDLCSPEWSGTARSFGADKLLKLSALFSLMGLPDCAAEVLITFPDEFNGLDVNHALDLLAADAQPDVPDPLGYKDYMRLFEKNDPSFYP